MNEPTKAAIEAARTEVAKLRQHLFGGDLDAFPEDDRHWAHRIVSAAYAVDGVRGVPALTEFRALLEDDGYAATFQTLGQYRTALIRALKSVVETPAGAAPGCPTCGGKLILVMPSISHDGITHPSGPEQPYCEKCDCKAWDGAPPL